MSVSASFIITYPHNRGLRFVFDLASLQNTITLKIMVGIAPNLGHRDAFMSPLIFNTLNDLGVMPRNLYMTFSFLTKYWRTWTLALKLLGLEWCNLGKS